MDVGLYREDEQFSFSSSPYTETYSSDMSTFESLGQSEFFEQIHYMPEPPNDIFEWNNESDKGLNSELDRYSQTHEGDVEQSVTDSSQSKADIQKVVNIQSWQSVWPTITNGNDVHLQEILELPEIVNNIKDLESSNIKPEHIYDNRISETSNCSELETDKQQSRLSESSDLLNVSFSSTDMTNFDIAEYIFEEKKQSKQSLQSDCTGIKQEVETQLLVPKIEQRTVRAGRKKIDLKAQKYIIDNCELKKSPSDDECDVDIETVSEEENEPVLEAGDLTSLLEKFEATELNKNAQCEQVLNVKVKVELETEENSDWSKSKNKLIKEEWSVESSIANESRCNKKLEKEYDVKNIKKEKIEVKEEIICKQEVKIEQTKPATKNSYLPKKLKDSTKPATIQNTNKPAIAQNTTKPTDPTTSFAPAPANNRHIINSLPQDLINRIKESGKRKPITVIQPIPNKKTKTSKIPEPHRTVQSVKTDTVHLDHNYCSSSSNVPVVKRDSGFVSEEDDRTIISRQPTVKNADGTLMVSLLKVNTIRRVEPSCNNKKKLNLEEYKKRRKDFLIPKSRSQDCSPNTSTCSSPPLEDEQQRIIRHQEKLRKMAEELLNSAPKSEKKPGSLLPPTSSSTSSASASPASTYSNVKVETPVQVELPVRITTPKRQRHMERKEFVSFGVNTDFHISPDVDPLEPVVKLQEIKPLLEKASDIISDNSLISSVIENIPKVMDKKVKVQLCQTNEEQLTHGEDRQVYFVEVDRVRCPTRTISTQTSLSMADQIGRGRARIRKRSNSGSSSSSYNSRKSNASKRSRHNSNSSSSSCSSRSSRPPSSSSSSARSSSYYSRQMYSRSRSRSPRYKRRTNTGNPERDHLNAVEERRIIYVGRILTGTSKDDLRRKFQKFGPINKISLHFRDIGENYGFVTFKYKEDAHAAYERGNDDPAYPYYKISFGGRREFCQSAYSDLDNMRDESYYQSKQTDDSYDRLLKDALEKLKKRKA